jgi:hypothetical protein|tara:strand:- start:37252 stop:37434 length:183 start_codon:yes stop_codon:yes gene_type:complete
MSEPTVLDAEFEEAEITIEERVEALESIVKGLLEANKNILTNFREMITAVTEISEESSEE